MSERRVRASFSFLDGDVSLYDMRKWDIQENHTSVEHAVSKHIELLAGVLAHGRAHGAKALHDRRRHLDGVECCVFQDK